MRLCKRKLTKLQQILKDSKSIGIFTHAGLDPDAQGSAFGTYFLLKAKFPKKKIKVFIYEKPIKGMPVPQDFKYYSSFNKSIEDIKNTDLIFVTDVSDKVVRSLKDISKESQLRELLQTKTIVVIDHHTENNLDPAYKKALVFRYNEPSASEIVASMFKKLNYRFTEEAIFNLLTGIISDSGQLRYITSKNTGTLKAIEMLMNESKQTLELYKIFDVLEIVLPIRFLAGYKKVVSSLEIKKDWAFAYVSHEDFKGLDEQFSQFKLYVLYKFLASLAGVNQYVFIYPKLGENNLYSVSLRSKEVDVSKIATKFGGGGHKNSAAFRIKAESPKQILENVKKELKLANLL